MHGVIQAVSDAACIVRLEMNLSFPWWDYLASAAAYTAFIFIGEVSKRQRRIFSKRNPRSSRATLWIHAIFFLLLLEYIQAATFLASALPDWLTTPLSPADRFYLPPKLIFL